MLTESDSRKRNATGTSLQSGSVGMTSSDTELVVGLRVDVDTYRGTRDGVPELLATLDARKCFASFFFSVGPDNMGRHLWRLANPKFLIKMLRSNAASLYGWDILLRGLLWPGPNIGNAFPDVLRNTLDAGHEVGLHAWDHHAWQMRLYGMSCAEIDEQVQRGLHAMQEILGTRPACSAAAGWICNDEALRAKERAGMQFNSDCRGWSIFRPIVDGIPLAPQIPVTLPTYDEAIGRNGVTDSNYNNFILDQVRIGEVNVLTVHAEVEGIEKNWLFREFLDESERRRIRFVPLRELLPDVTDIPFGKIETGQLPGRAGRFCLQVAA